MPYWIVDYVKSPGSGQTADPCNDKGMYFRGVEIDISISQQASPDWRHLKWDVSHRKRLLFGRLRLISCKLYGTVFTVDCRLPCVV